MALSQEQFNQLLLDAEDSTGFGINRYNELKDLGATQEQIAQIAANAPVIGPKAREALPELRDIFYNNIRNELETQYNNIVEAGKIQGKDLSYRGQASDLPTIWNQQARQLASAGVSSITNLRQGSEDVRTGERFGNVVVGQNPILIDQTTGQKVSTTNLGGSIAVDRDTGAQKFGDIFSGVKGGANYGIQFAPDGSPILFPVWEKTKSPIAQIGLGGLEDVIGPALTIAGAYYGIPGLGEVGGAAAGAAAGNTAGQYLASGDIDWKQVALSAAVAGGTQAALGGAEVAGAEALPDASSIVVPDSLAAPFYPGDPSAIASVGGGSGLLATESAGMGISGGGLSSAEMAALKGGEAYGTVSPGMAISGGGLTSAEMQALKGAEAYGPSAASSFGAAEALRVANLGQQLFGGQPQMGGLLGGQRGGGQPMGVDYSGLLSLLQSRTATPNVAPLLAPAVNPYQPLLGATTQSLLG